MCAADGEHVTGLVVSAAAIGDNARLIYLAVSDAKKEVSVSARDKKDDPRYIQAIHVRKGPGGPH